MGGRRAPSGMGLYRELLKQVVQMFETRQLPIDLRETLEIVAFIEAARRSAEAGGTPVEIHV
jgi:virulence factor